MSRGFGSVRPHKQGWQARIYIDGIRRSHRFAKDERPLAVAWLKAMQQRKVELIAGLAAPAGTDESVTFGDVAEEMLVALHARKRYTPKTRREMRYETERVLLVWRDQRIASTRTADVDAYAAELLHAGRSSSRVRKLLDRLAQMMEHAVRRGYIGRIPCKVERPRLVQRTVILDMTDEEVARLVARCWEDYDKRAVAVVLLARHAGLRAGDLAVLRGEDLNLERGYVRVEVRGESDRPKAPRSRTVPIEDADTLTALAALRPRRGEPLLGVRSGPGAVAIVRRAWVAALGKPPELHRLRHTYATREAARGVPIPLLQARLGHASVATTMRYVHMTDPLLTGHEAPRETGQATKSSGTAR